MRERHACHGHDSVTSTTGEAFQIYAASGEALGAATRDIREYFWLSWWSGMGNDGGLRMPAVSSGLRVSTCWQVLQPHDDLAVASTDSA